MRARLLFALLMIPLVSGCEPMTEPRLPEDEEDEEAPGEETGMIPDTHPSTPVPLLLLNDAAVLA